MNKEARYKSMQKEVKDMAREAREDRGKNYLEGLELNHAPRSGKPSKTLWQTSHKTLDDLDYMTEGN